MKQEDGTYRLRLASESNHERIPAWVFVFDIDASASTTPNPVMIDTVIGATAKAFIHHALVDAPAHAGNALFADTGIYAILARRLRGYWPDEFPQLARRGK